MGQVSRSPRRKHFIRHDATPAEVEHFVGALLGDPIEAARRSDPMLRYIPEEEAPAAFWRLPPQLRSQRARLHIIARCAGSDPIYSWMITMDMSDEGKALAEEIVGENDDARIEEMMRVDGGWLTPSRGDN